MIISINKTKLTFLFLTTLVFTTPFIAQSQLGCTDPTANNYNSSAATNDGSCTYNLSSYNPTVRVDPLDSILIETSGLQVAGGYLWSFNDGGGKATLYRIDTLTSTILQTVNLQGATNIDWEDIAFDGTHFYIGDFGNNANGARTDLKIYKFPLSAIPPHANNPVVNIAPGAIEIINFAYADQPQPAIPVAPNATRFDCEAMIVDEGKIHLFSKNWLEAITTHYVINTTQAGTYSASPVETLVTNYLVTGADKAIAQNVIALLGYQPTGTANHFMHLLSNYSSGLYFNGNKRRIDLPNASVMGQAEGITFKNNTYGYISNERLSRTFGNITINISPKLFSFNTNDFSSVAALPLQESNFKVEQLDASNKVTWKLNGTITNFEIQHSADGTTFTTLKKSDQQEGVYHHKTSAPLNCYRLAWQNTNRALQYSNTSCISNNQQKEIRNVLLRANGNLSFVVEGTQGRNYTFTVVTVDGKLIGKTSMKTYSPGSNFVVVTNKPIAANGVVVLVIEGSGAKQTKLLQAVKL